MKSWNNCVKLSDTNDVPLDIDGKMWGAYLNYMGTSGNYKFKGPIWFDKEAAVCFGPDQDYFSDRQEYSFYHQPENFLFLEPWGKMHLQKYLGQYLGTDCTESPEIIFHNHPFF